MLKNLHASGDFGAIIPHYGYKLAIDVDLTTGLASEAYELADQEANNHRHRFHEKSQFFLLPDVITEEDYEYMHKDIRDIVQEFYLNPRLFSDKFDINYCFEEIQSVINELNKFEKSRLWEFLDGFLHYESTKAGVAMYYCDDLVLTPDTTDEDIKYLAESLVDEGEQRSDFAREDELFKELKKIQAHLSTSSTEEIHTLLYNN